MVESIRYVATTMNVVLYLVPRGRPRSASNQVLYNNAGRKQETLKTSRLSHEINSSSRIVQTYKRIALTRINN